MDDDLFRCEVILVEMNGHREAIERLGRERTTLLSRLRADGHGLGELAARLGVSKGRMQQLTRAPKVT